MSFPELLDEDRGSPPSLERQHGCSVRIISGEHIGSELMVNSEHPKRHVSLASVWPTEVRDLVSDFDAERIPDVLAAHTRPPNPLRILPGSGDAGCDSVRAKSIPINICLVATAATPLPLGKCNVSGSGL